MDPVTVGAVLLAVATGFSEALGSRLWEGLVSLVKRPFHKPLSDGGMSADTSGEAQLFALRGSPGDQQRAVALAGVLLDRAAVDEEFSRAFQSWWAQAGPVRERVGDVSNTISGGTFSGPVLLGRDFSGLTFGAPSAPPVAPPGDRDTAE
jgi:hypothetical protein